MIKVLIVDDEPLIREAFRSKVDWEDLGFKIIAEAKNGLEALGLVKKLKPDVVFTDMKMPLMDGIGLIKELKDLGITAKVVVISAFSSFIYTHTAIQCGAYEYLLKPINKNELMEVLGNLQRELLKDQRSTSYIKAENQMKVSTSIDMFFKGFRSYFFIDTTASSPEIIDVEIKLDLMAYTCLIIDVEGMEKQISERFGTSEKFCAQITESAYGIFSNDDYDVVTFINPLYNDRLFMIVGHKTSSYLTFEYVEAFWVTVGELIGKDVSVGVGNTYDNFNQVNQSFMEALEAILCTGIIESHCVIFMDETRQKKKPIIYSSEKEVAFLTSLDVCNWIEMEHNIRDLFGFLRKSKGITFRQVYRLCSELLFLCERVLRKYDGTLNEIFTHNIVSIEYIASKGSIEHLEHWFTSVILEIMNYIKEQRSTNMAPVIDELKAYMEVNYFENITLSGVSKKYHMNKSYLSSLFKKKAGMTFGDYLLKVRMDKAKELVGNKRYKIYEVAKMVGYEDARYFARKFKNYVGVTPDEYRKKL